MSVIVVDTNAVIMHGRAFSDRVRAAVENGRTIVLPQSVKRELVDDVLEDERAPPNHRGSALEIQQLVDDGYLVVRSPDFTTSSRVIDETRRRISDESTPEHEVKADQYIPALICDLARDGPVSLVTADQKLRRITRDIVDRHGLIDHVELRDPLTVL